MGATISFPQNFSTSPLAAGSNLRGRVVEKQRDVLAYSRPRLARVAMMSFPTELPHQLFPQA
jgi:hypothetical protein